MLTSLILILIGLFSAAGGILNWEWFFQSYKARFIASILGRTWARAFYIMLGLFIMFAGGLAGFSEMRSGDKPPLMSTEPMLQELTFPFGYSLASPGSTKLLMKEPTLEDLVVSETGQWRSFSAIWKRGHPLWLRLRYADPAPSPGFGMDRIVDDHEVSGTIFYFDKDLNPCGDWLTSKHGRHTAEFIVVVLDEASTEEVTGQFGLKAIWLHRTSPMYRKYTSF